MIIIHSSNFVNAEFEAEIGLIPPCMLPIGNKKMLELQVRHLRTYFADENIIITLPRSYQLTINEQAVISSLDVSVQRISDKISFAEAMLYVLNIEIAHPTEQIRILQGDRLLKDIPINADCIAIANQCRQGDWYDRYQRQDHESRWLGYFAFSSKANLVQALALSINSFPSAVAHYQKSIVMDRVEPTEWYNCSHFNSYFDARSSITTQRSFNTLVIESGVVTKSSDDDIKIQAEIYWFSHLPAALKRFTPQFIGSGRLQDGMTTYYCLEFLPLLPLNELYVHGRNPTWFWHHIFNLVKDYFGHATHKDHLVHFDPCTIEECRDDLYRKKTLARLAAYQESSQIDLHAPIIYQGVALGSILDIAHDCIEQTLKLPSRAMIMHGDFCFSNILFDSRARRLKLIDPRGIDCHDNFSIYGDITYDLAKLTHSVIGMYDFIIAGRFEILPDTRSSTGKIIHFDSDERLERIQADFLQFCFVDELSIGDIIPAVVLLFLSMLPLHADRPDRQQAMLLNAFRLYQQYVHQPIIYSQIDIHSQISNDIQNNVAPDDHVYSNDVLEG